MKPETAPGGESAGQSPSSTFTGAQPVSAGPGGPASASSSSASAPNPDPVAGLGLPIPQLAQQQPATDIPTNTSANDQPSPSDLQQRAKAAGVQFTPQIEDGLRNGHPKVIAAVEHLTSAQEDLASTPHETLSDSVSNPVTPQPLATIDTDGNATATPAPDAKENSDAVQPSGPAGQQDASASASGLQKIIEHGEVSYGELQKLQLTEDEVATVQQKFGGTTPSWTAEKVKETTGLGAHPGGLVRQPRADELREKYPGLSDDEVASQEAYRRNALQAKILLFKKFGGKDFQRYRLAGALADLADVATLPLMVPSAAATPFVGSRIAEQIGAQSVRTTGSLARAGAENLSADEALTHAADTATAIASPASRNITASIDFDHVIGADVKANGKATGGHTLMNGDVRIVPGTETTPNAQGVYKVGVEMAHPTTPGVWVRKTSNGGINTMFPKAWSADKVRDEIDAAWHSPAKITEGNIWRSTTPSGVQIKGYISPKTTAYPLY